MQPLTDAQLLWIWETGLTQAPFDRALTMLATANPEQSLADLAAWPVGRRDEGLLALLEQTFGTTVVAYATCPACQEPLELALNTADLRLTPPAGPEPETYMASVDGYDLHFRLPASLDLAAVSRLTGLGTARRLLAERCLLDVRRDGADVAAETLPESVIAALAAHMAACDPQAEVDLSLICPVCGHAWSILFEATAFLWTEISALARRLLYEIHTLALAYGWSESQILALGPTRRQAYLEWVFNG